MSDERVVVIDGETTIRNNGNPFDPNNRLCSFGVLDDGEYTDYAIEYDGAPYSDQLECIKGSVEGADVVVGFNLKFDLNWLRRYLGSFRCTRFWDCQLADYILSHQTNIFPSLDDCCDRAGLGRKLDVVATQYWANGIDTPDVPYSTLAEYLRRDVDLTYELYLHQKAKFEADPALYKLFQLGCEDLRWLAEAEFNGLVYNVDASREKCAELAVELDSIHDALNRLYDCPHLDWGSSDHISIVLYGGILYFTGRETYTKQLKAGPVERERNAWLPWEFKSQLKPPRNSENAPLNKMSDEELAKGNIERIADRKKPFVRTYSVAEDILRNFKPKGKVKQTIELLLRRAELQKLISTYYGGIPAIMEKHEWTELHGQFNQVGTRTGRLSSSKPNLQNFAGDIKYLFESRYE
jgi:DNA polymerase I-like protein with 3'-5' exonuclease and polymerase domains